LHYEHAQQCLRYGAHVLCEKPLVGDDHKAPIAVVREAQALVELARNAGVLLGTQMQYAVAAGRVLELAGAAGRGRPLTQWSMEIESKMVRPGRGHELIWIDLSPHPLSVLQKMGDAAIEWDTVRCNVEKLETHVHCKTRFAGSELACDTDIIVRCNPHRITPRRRFTINGRSVDYQARKNAAGDFKAFFQDQAGNEVELPDLVDSLIGNFVKACRGEEELLVTGADGARNVEWQLGLLTHRS
jgi:predicted dehydrogenase